MACIACLRPSLVLTTQGIPVPVRTWTGSYVQQWRKQKAAERKDFRLKVAPGTGVKERQILVSQRELDYHPGLNAILDPRNNTIFALCDGTFYVSTEKTTPDLRHEIAEKYYASRVGQQIHKRFLNVIPEKPGIQFRLIDLV